MFCGGSRKNCKGFKDFLFFIFVNSEWVMALVKIVKKGEKVCEWELVEIWGKCRFANVKSLLSFLAFLSIFVVQNIEWKIENEDNNLLKKPGTKCFIEGFSRNLILEIL